MISTREQAFKWWFYFRLGEKLGKFEKCCLNNPLNFLSCFKNVENIRAVVWYRTDWSKGGLTQRCSVKRVFLEISQNLQENNCVRGSASACKFIKKKTLVQVFSCEFCKTFKEIFSYRTHPVSSSRSSRC